jgi:hypothetical protein
MELVNTALEACRPVKPVDFTPRLNGSTTSLGKNRRRSEDPKCRHYKHGTITVRATIVDSDGIPLNRLGVATKSPVSMSFFIAGGPDVIRLLYNKRGQIDTEQQPPQTQVANESGGTFTTNAISDYAYSFKTKAPATFRSHPIGVSARRNLSEFGTFDEWSETCNDVFNFVPNANPVAVTRSVVTA